MKQSKEPSLLVKTVRCSVSENNCRHPFWPRFNVSIICTLCIDVPERNRLFVELGHMPEYHLATAHRRVWLIVAGRGSRVASPMSRVASPKSRSRVQCRGRGSNVAAGENDLKTTDMKTIWREKNLFYARYSTIANLQVTDVRVNKIMSQEKT